MTDGKPAPCPPIFYGCGPCAGGCAGSGTRPRQRRTQSPPERNGQGRPEEDEELLRRKQPSGRCIPGGGSTGGIRSSQTFRPFIISALFHPPQAAAINPGGHGIPLMSSLSAGCCQGGMEKACAFMKANPAGRWRRLFSRGTRTPVGIRPNSFIRHLAPEKGQRMYRESFHLAIRCFLEPVCPWFFKSSPLFRALGSRHPFLMIDSSLKGP